MTFVRNAGYMDVELKGNVLGRKAGIVVARLIAELAVNSEAAVAGGVGRHQLSFHRECVRINVQFLAGVKGKRDVFAWGEDNSSGRKIGGRLKLQCGRD